MTSPDPQPGPYVHRCIRAGYPITHAEALRWATTIADATHRPPPANIHDTLQIVYLLDIIFCKYNDLDCFPITNPNDPETNKKTWIVATTPHRWASFPQAEIDEKIGKNNDFWTPSVHLPESELDIDAKEALERKGVCIYDSHHLHRSQS